jgi:glyoxylase-like metal-dependent hydrolase (beta-lactamase superfamily II)
MLALVGGLTDKPLTLVVSHAHWDHIGHAAAFAAAGVGVLVTAEQAPALAAGLGNAEVRAGFAPHRLTGPLPQGFDPATATFPPVRASALLRDGDLFELGGWSLEVLVGGGHTPGLATLMDRNRGVLFSTDAVYAEAPLYAQFDDSDLLAYLAEMERLAALAPHLKRLYPSHGPAPIAPTFIMATLDALREIVAGRTPDDLREGVAAHRVSGLTVLVPVAGG